MHQVGVARLKHQITGFIVDYWQLVEGQESRESEERHLRRVAQSISNFARRQGLWCILLAQMNQEGKLFGGNGLRKACDQLYFIETVEGFEDVRWLRMDASRYTPKSDVGEPTHPAFAINKKTGPYIIERNGQSLIAC
jgi:replicative DNA helicase